MANPYFYASFYLARNPDLVRAGLTVDNVEQHYVQYGAAESVTNANRAPNPWFDADFYLRSNPDLIEAGLTIGDALGHYAQYGVLEGRAFSPDPALDPSEFDAQAYAEANADVAEALGIDLESGEDLTQLQINQLLGHFLAYGLREGRAANDAFNDLADALPIPVLDGEVTLGTNADDIFAWDASSFQEASVDGLAGNDEIIISDAAAALTLKARNLENVTIVSATVGASLAVNGGGVQNVSVDTDDTFTYTGDLVESVEVVAGSVIASFDEDDVEGDGTSLNVTAARDTTFTTQGVEDVTLNVLNSGANDDIILNLNEVEGEELNVTVETDVKEFFLVVNSVNAVVDYDLETVTIDASGATNGISITLGVDLATDADLDIALTGGAGRDILVANEGIDVLTGGAGDDAYNFTAATAAARITNGVDVDDAELEGWDIIVGFEAGDVINFTGLAVATTIDAAIGTLDASGVLEFAFGVPTTDLQDIVELLASDTTIDGALLFQFGANTYVYAGATLDGDGDLDTAQLIQLSGVSADDLEIGVGVITFA